MTVDLTVLSAFILVLARTSAWVVTTPFMGGKALPSIAKMAVAISLSVFVTPMVHPDNIPSDVVNTAGSLRAHSPSPPAMESGAAFARSSSENCEAAISR